MTTFEQETKILKDYVAKCIEKLENGESVRLSGNYITHSYKDGVIDKNCNKIARKLSELGYEYTTNHGFGCLDYRFLKRIEL